MSNLKGFEMGKPKVAVYYFPNYHVDERNEKVHGKGWTEWELMKRAVPRFPGHDQPKIPLWGYEDEADPAVMSRKIDAAADHGIDAFIFDWYWYDGPFLERALNEGFLKSGNDRLQFALMWANHDWRNCHPAGKERPLLYPWTTTYGSVGMVWDYLIEHYFTHPLYMRVKGMPYFSIYLANRFIAQMGGTERCTEVIALLQEKAKKAGLPGIHIGGMWWDNMDSKPESVCPQSDWVEKIGFRSYTNYNVPHGLFAEDQFPRVDYDEAYRRYEPVRDRAIANLPAVYYPIISMGWDCSPRAIQSDVFEKGSYPFTAVMEPTPEKFGAKVAETVRVIKDWPEEDRMFFINAWNEWTEGSYLEPDTKHGFAFLEALKQALQS